MPLKKKKCQITHDFLNLSFYDVAISAHSVLLLSFIILIADILLGANLFRHDFFLSLKLISLFIFYATNPWGVERSWCCKEAIQCTLRRLCNIYNSNIFFPFTSFLFPPFHECFFSIILRVASNGKIFHCLYCADQHYIYHNKLFYPQ